MATTPTPKTLFWKMDNKSVTISKIDEQNEVLRVNIMRTDAMSTFPESIVIFLTKEEAAWLADCLNKGAKL